MPENPPDDDLVLPVLLGEARKTYGLAIARALADAGYDDVPRLGPRLIGGIARYGSPAGELPRLLGVSKQAASQLVDTVVMRGYVTRRPDPEDRRRLNLELTERGVHAAEIIRTAVDGIDEQLAATVDAATIAAVRSALVRLIDIGDSLRPTR